MYGNYPFVPLCDLELDSLFSRQPLAKIDSYTPTGRHKRELRNAERKNPLNVVHQTSEDSRFWSAVLLESAVALPDWKCNAAMTHGGTRMVIALRGQHGQGRALQVDNLEDSAECMVTTTARTSFIQTNASRSPQKPTPLHPDPTHVYPILPEMRCQ